MGSRIPSRRLGQTALAAFRTSSTRWVPSTSLPAAAQRNNSNRFRPKDTGPDLSNPLMEQYLKRKAIEEGTEGAEKSKKPDPPPLRRGKMNTDPDALFVPESEIPGWNPNLPAQKQKQLLKEAEARKAAIEAQKERELSDLTLDPDPRARMRLQRKLVIAGVKRHGRMTKAQKIARTERQSVYKSHALPTSTKKMQKVVNQLAGKTVSDALLQLRFSPKRIARDVAKGLEIAQNEAILARGMGLGSGRRAQKRWEEQRGQGTTDVKAASDVSESRPAKAYKAAMIELKDGSKKFVRDPSEIYIDQAWVGKGETWKSPEFRARGKVNMLRHRTTSFTFLLKEEKTRMRISDEIKKKRDNRKLWTALPDRPVTAQRQYCLW